MKPVAAPALAALLCLHAPAVTADEVTLVATRPLGPVRQLFTADATARRSPVIMDHGGVEEIEARIAWPQGWSLATSTEPAAIEMGIGGYRSNVSVDAAQRTAVFKRRMDVRKREPADRIEFAALRNLYAEAERRDAQALVFARR